MAEYALLHLPMRLRHTPIKRCHVEVMSHPDPDLLVTHDVLPA
jgi:hypothetical protein